MHCYMWSAPRFCAGSYFVSGVWNELCFGEFHVKLTCFVDGTRLSHVSDKVIVAKSAMHIDLGKMTKWFTVNKIALRPNLYVFHQSDRTPLNISILNARFVYQQEISCAVNALKYKLNISNV